MVMNQETTICRVHKRHKQFIIFCLIKEQQ